MSDGAVSGNVVGPMVLRAEIQRVWSYLRPERWWYSLGLFSLLVVNITDVLGPVFIGLAVDLLAAKTRGLKPGTPRILEVFGWQAADFTLFSAVAVYFSLQVLTNLFRYPMLTCVSIPSHRVGQTLRNRLAGHALRLSLPYYHRSRSGDLMSLATADIPAVRMFFGIGILLLVDTAMLLLFTLVVMAGLSLSLALAAVLPLPLIALFTQKFSHAEFNRFQEVQEDLGRLTERTRESYAGIPIIQGFAREEFDRARFTDASWQHWRKNMRLAWVRSLFDPSLDLMMGLSTVLVLAVGGFQIAAGTMSLGTFVAFIYLIGFLSGPMIGFGWAVSLLQRGRASLDRLERFWSEPVEIQDAPGAREPEGEGDLVIRNLTFRHAAAKEGAPPALEGISLHLVPGKTLGVIGPVGAGKSTLAHLLVRLYDPPPGTIFLDGLDLREWTLSGLRRRVVLIPQDPFLFSDTVNNNIALAPETRNITREHLQEVLHLASLHEEIQALPEGLGTLLGERGVNLSGGQRQRVAIARAVATNPCLLIQDDCLAAVDARTEEIILTRLGESRVGRSGIVISHRVAAVKRCDEIVVLEHGRITARGTHAELAAQPGFYATVARQQTEDGRRKESA